MNFLDIKYSSSTINKRIYLKFLEDLILLLTNYKEKIQKDFEIEE